MTTTEVLDDFVECNRALRNVREGNPRVLGMRGIHNGGPFRGSLERINNIKR